jgi:hypothetical protein
MSTQLGFEINLAEASGACLQVNGAKRYLSSSHGCPPLIALPLEPCRVVPCRAPVSVLLLVQDVLLVAGHVNEQGERRERGVCECVLR